MKFIFRAWMCVVAILFVSNPVSANGPMVALPPSGGMAGAPVVLPEVSDENANIPVIDLNPPKKFEHISSEIKLKSTQHCDPTLDLQIYKNLETYYCLQSPTANCQQGIRKLVSKYGKEALAILVMGASSSTYFIGHMAEDYFMMRSMQTGPNAMALNEARKKINALAVSAEVSENPRLKAMLDEALKAKSPKAFGNLLAKMVKGGEDDVASMEIRAALDLIPKSRVSRAAVAAALAGGVVSALAMKASTVVSMAADATPTGCDTAGANYMALDKTNQCRPKYIINENVANFMTLSHEDKVQLLNETPALCSYYKQFNEHLKNWIKPTSSISNFRCSGSGVSYEVDVDGSRLRLTTSYSEDGSAKLLNVDNIMPAKSLEHPGDFQVTFVSDGEEPVIQNIRYRKRNFAGKPEKVYSEESYDKFFDKSRVVGWGSTYKPFITSTLFLHKLYSEVGKTCCSLKDDADSAKCIEAINRPTAKTMHQLEQEVHGLPAAR